MWSVSLKVSYCAVLTLFLVMMGHDKMRGREVGDAGVVT